RARAMGGAYASKIAGLSVLLERLVIVAVLVLLCPSGTVSWSVDGLAVMLEFAAEAGGGPGGRLATRKAKKAGSSTGRRAGRRVAGGIVRAFRQRLPACGAWRGCAWERRGVVGYQAGSPANSAPRL